MTSEEIKDQDRPLVTFALFAYNQERFIREAVEGAFSQTYSPLEIILSDDCSSDRTFEIMQEMAAEYDGPHTVILNRNEKNLRIGGHVNRMMEIESGELIVVAAGDDISLPERTSVLMLYAAENNDLTGVCSAWESIDEVGNSLGLGGWGNKNNRSPLLVKKYSGTPLSVYCISGCAAAWHRRVFREFPPLPSDIVCEDLFLTHRALLIGNILNAPDPLVKYRQNGASVTSTIPQYRNSSYENFRTQEILFCVRKKWDVNVFDALLSEIKGYSFPDEYYAEGFQTMLRNRRNHAIIKTMWWKWPITTRWAKTIAWLISCDTSDPRGLEINHWMLARLFGMKSLYLYTRFRKFIFRYSGI